MEGSSSSMSFRPLMKARPTASICCSPPLSVPAFWRSRSASRGKMDRTRSMSRLMPLSLRAKQDSLRFSITVRLSNSRRPSGTWEMASWLTTLSAEYWSRSLSM